MLNLIKKMLNNNEIIPSNPPRKKIQKKVQPVYDDDEFINDYEDDVGDFEQELLNQQKNKLKIPRSLKQSAYNELNDNDVEDFSQNKKKKINENKQVKKNVKNYNQQYYNPNQKKNITTNKNIPSSKKKN